MKNDIKKVVLFTIRDIEKKTLFKSVEPETTDSLISYFGSLSDLGAWLVSKVSPSEQDITKGYFDIDSFRQEIEKKKEELNKAIKELSSLFDEEDSFFFSSLYEKLSKEEITDLLATKALFRDCMKDVADILTDTQKAAYLLIDSILGSINIGPETKTVFTSANYPGIKDLVLNGTNTYCDKGDGEVKVKHRLGMYHIEEGEIAVCALFPWTGNYEGNHDELWTKMLVDSVIEFYPNVETVILVCHDIDFGLYAGKDFVVSENINEGGPYGNNKKISLVVFQHSNSEITSTLSKTSPKEVYTLMENYVFGFVKIENADTDKKNAIAHKEKYKSSEIATI